MNLEKIEKEGDPKAVWGLKTAKDFRGYMTGRISHFMKFDSPSCKENEMMLRSILKVYDHFHPIKPIELDPWRGKSGFQVIKMVSGYKVIEHRKPDKFSEPKEVSYFVTKIDLEAVYRAIAKLLPGKAYKTRQVAQIYCLENKITENDEGRAIFPDGLFNFANVSGCRPTYFRFYYALKVLEWYKVIKYEKSGKITRLKEINSVLDL